MGFPMNARPVTLLDVLGAAQSGQVALAPESAGYLALGLADALVAAPRAPEATEVILAENGQVDVLSRAPASDRAAEAAARSLLGQLLGVAGSSAPALSSAAKRALSSGPSAVVRDIEAALIPVNRAAAKRALARLHRETARVRGDALEIPYTPPRAADAHAPTPTDRDHLPDVLEQDGSIVIGELSMPIGADFDPSVPLPVGPRGTKASPPPPSDAVADALREPPASPPAAPSSRPESRDRDDRGWQPRPPRARTRTGTYLAAALVVVGLGLLIWVYLRHPELITGHR